MENTEAEISETGCEMTTQLDDVRLQRFARDPAQGHWISTVAPVQEQLQALILKLLATIKGLAAPTRQVVFQHLPLGQIWAKHESGGLPMSAHLASAHEVLHLFPGCWFFVLTPSIEMQMFENHGIDGIAMGNFGTIMYNPKRGIALMKNTAWQPSPWKQSLEGAAPNFFARRWSTWDEIAVYDVLPWVHGFTEDMGLHYRCASKSGYHAVSPKVNRRNDPGLSLA